MRPWFAAVLCGLMLSLGCAKEPAEEKKKPPPRRMMKPGDKPGEPGKS